MTNSEPLSISIIVGSNRAGSQSRRVGNFLEAELRQKPEVQVELLDLHLADLPLFEDENYSNNQNVQEFSNKLQASQGFVIIAPEWNGMVPAALKNIFLHFTHPEFGHKPALLVGVSSGRGGAFPIAEMRQSSYKNSRICYLPEHVIIREVKTLNLESRTKSDQDVSLSETEIYLQNRMRYCLDLLLAYTKALNMVRESGVIDTTNFKNGMS